jgi:2-phosphosulfolactate phosphatase
LILSVQKLPRPLVNHRTVAVVVDVLRATSVMATAVEHGAKQVITCLEIDDAVRLAKALPADTLLCGERHCKPIAGFHLGNSPCDYSKETVSGKTLVMTTTNGTRALNAAAPADKVFVGAFVNLSSLAEQIVGQSDITIVCAGTDGYETEEDILFAGALALRLRDSVPTAECDEPAEEAIALWREHIASGESLAERLCQSRGGRNLVDAGYLDDVRYCARIDAVSAVPSMIARQPITLTRSRR